MLNEDKLDLAAELTDSAKWESTYDELEADIIGDRWLRFQDKKTTVCYDLSSFSKTSNNKQVRFDRAELASGSSETEIVAALREIAPSHEMTEREGYPVRCICGNATSVGTMSMNSKPGSTVWSYLGRAVCVDCMIRYSVFQKRWECFKAVLRSDNNEINRCSAEVKAPEYCCGADHVTHSMVQSITITGENDANRTQIQNMQTRVEFNARILKPGEKAKVSNS